MELSRSSGLTLGDRVVRYEEICPFRQPLEVTVITVGVTGKHDGPAAYADTPGDGGYVSNSRYLHTILVDTLMLPRVALEYGEVGGVYQRLGDAATS